MLPVPTPDYVRRRLAEFDASPRYYGAERTLQLAFGQWPRNDDYDHVLIKVILLNRLYSTNIFDVFTVAQHIVNQRIDDRLAAHDQSVVTAIAKVPFRARARTLLSFATKYCSWHRPDGFQIYDAYVDWLLWQSQREHRFATFKRWELREYPRFVQIVDAYRHHFGLGNTFTRKQIDKFLWIEGVTQWAATQTAYPSDQG